MEYTPKPLLNDGKKIKGKTECHFLIFDWLTIAFVEVQPEVLGCENGRDVIAHVILECDGQASLFKK